MSQEIGIGGGGNIMRQDQNITSNTTLSANQNYMSIGPVQINSGVTVTVPSGTTWVVV